MATGESGTGTTDFGRQHGGPDRRGRKAATGLAWHPAPSCPIPAFSAG